MFASSAETLFDARNLTRAFRLAATKAALSDFRFHDLRHTLPLGSHKLVSICTRCNVYWATKQQL